MGGQTVIQTGNDIAEATKHANPGSSLGRAMHPSWKEDAYWTDKHAVVPCNLLQKNHFNHLFRFRNIPEIQLLFSRKESLSLIATSCTKNIRHEIRSPLKSKNRRCPCERESKSPFLFICFVHPPPARYFLPITEEEPRNSCPSKQPESCLDLPDLQRVLQQRQRIEPPSAPTPYPAPFAAPVPVMGHAGPTSCTKNMRHEIRSPFEIKEPWLSMRERIKVSVPFHLFRPPPPPARYFLPITEEEPRK
ncbi:hypothetical protein CDAR_191351 [Caerostris darwini]|uniref:Uncharacterized protein n=1 Tax=Caerostris darwini TaxID=1538125 RepID=A0AAV4VF12_9ARAC|nr:hypothetical protein CDAR_191351 [Caerostris darwini]